MSALPTSDELDEILALQLSIAWAGERAGGRFGWWSSDLVDPLGGADLFGRLVPRTAPWAALSLVRQVARRIDEDARAKLAPGDRVWTLYSFGFDVDEALDARLARHRHDGVAPELALGANLRVGGELSREALAAWLHGLVTTPPRVEPTTVGRRLTARHATPIAAARALAAALLPLEASYPAPHVEAGA